MIISLLAAMDHSRGIGKENKLPWRLSADLKRFKTLTMGHHLIMGRKTYESIGRPLPGRTTIIITRNRSYKPPNCQLDECLVAHSLSRALKIAESHGEEEAFVVGGAEIFQTALPLADRLYLTFVNAQIDCDVSFPDFSLDRWTVIETEFHNADENNQYPSTFQLLVRKRE